MRILLIEDEPEMARLIASLIVEAGYEIDRAGSGGEALEAVKRYPYDLMLLDRRLPDGDALALLPEFRASRPGIRLMMISALDGLNEKVSGLNAGADDYLSKPFQGEELIARIRACLRRPGCGESPPLVLGLLSFDVNSGTVSIQGAPLTLHKRELTLLEAFMRRANRVTTREVLLDEIYGLGDGVLQNTLDVLISRLRRRLTQHGAGVAIHTLRGVGYLMTEADS
jgi:two-component system, OmpR family, response regulator